MKRSRCLQMNVWCNEPLLVNAKFTHEHTKFAIPLLALSQFQTLAFHSSLKVHNNFLNDSIILIHNFFRLYKSTIMVNINGWTFHFISFYNYVWIRKLLDVHHGLSFIE